MTYPEHQLITYIHHWEHRGLALVLQGERLVVSPANRLTDEDRTIIHMWKPIILARLVGQDFWIAWTADQHIERVWSAPSREHEWSETLNDLRRLVSADTAAWWLRAQWWRGTTLLSDCYFPGTGARARDTQAS